MPHNGGRLQCGTQYYNSYFDTWALNVCKQTTTVFHAQNNTDDLWAGLKDKYGYPTAMPTGAGAYWRATQMWIYGVSGDEWDLYYPANKTVTLNAQFSGGNFSASVISPTHTRYTLTGTPTSGNACLECDLRITAMSDADWTGGIIVCAYKINGVVVDHKARLDAGEYFTPTSMARFSDYGKIRFMNWQLFGKGLETLHSQRNYIESFSWTSNLENEDWFMGEATKNRNDYVTDERVIGNPVAYSEGTTYQFILGTAPTFKTAASIATGATTTVTCTGHGFTSGDEIFFPNGTTWAAAWVTALFQKSAVTGLPPSFIVTVTDPDTFTIPVNSTGFAAGPTNFRVAWIITFSDGTLAPKRVYTGGWRPHWYTEWGSTPTTNGDTVTGVYHAEYDAIICGGDLNQFRLYPGPPVEIMCALAKQAGAHPFFTMPVWMKGSELRSKLQLIKDSLADDLELIPDFELLNEHWLDNGFYETCWSNSLAKFGLGSRYAGASDLHRSMTEEIATVFGSRPWRSLMATQLQIGLAGYALFFRGFMPNPMTVTIASPAVVTWTAHGRSAGDIVNFTTNGALPSGVNSSTTYYVLSTGLTTDTFRFSATLNGAAINSSGTQSGSHTVGTPADYTINESHGILTAAYVVPNMNGASNANEYPGYVDCILDWKAGRKDAAFQWFANEYLVGSTGGAWEKDNLALHINTYLPSWLSGQAIYTGRDNGGITVECYEGGQHISGPNAIDGGFPSGGVSVQDVHDFYTEYLLSNYHGWVMARCYQAMYDLGVRWPSMYCAISQWEAQGTWGAQRFRTFDEAETKWSTAIRNWSKNRSTVQLRCT